LVRTCPPPRSVKMGSLHLDASDAPKQKSEQNGKKDGPCARTRKEMAMLADAHRRAAEGIERALKKVWPSSDPDEGRLVIEGAWSASFHWIAYACQTKHEQHQESHARLGSFLRGLGETKAPDWWEVQDRLARGGL